MLPKSLLTHVSTARNLIPSAPCFFGLDFHGSKDQLALRRDYLATGEFGAHLFFRLDFHDDKPRFRLLHIKRVAGATSDVPRRSSTCRNFFRAPIPRGRKVAPAKGKTLAGAEGQSLCVPDSLRRRLQRAPRPVVPGV